MCPDARSNTARRKTARHGLPWAAVFTALLLVSWGGGLAAAAEGVATAPQPREVVGEVIDITGLMERPRGDTRLPWTLPEGFARSPELPVGRGLRDEVLRPVERTELQRLLEVERLLSR